MTASKIEWTDRSDWNPVRGCSRVSEGCRNCYAEVMAARFSKPGQWGYGFAEMQGGDHRWTGKVELQEDRLTLPLRWRKPAKIFASSTSDIFHESLPDEAIDKIFAAMALSERHTFQILTKRADRMKSYINRWFMRLAESNQIFPHPAGPTKINAIFDWAVMPSVLPNVHLGVSCERQHEADERRGPLAAFAAAGWTAFVSYEPALGPIDWKGWEFLRWLISGGESGPRARLSHPDWHRAARDFCAEHGVPYFFKQWGLFAPVTITDMEFVNPTPEHIGENVVLPNGIFCGYPQGQRFQVMRRVGKKQAGRLLDGKEHNEFPASRSSRITDSEHQKPKAEMVHP